MARRGSLSDFWREDVSDDRVRELTSVLRGSDSLIGVMGSGVRVVWSTNGESQTWWVRTKEGKPSEMRVFLDYTPLSPLAAPFRGDAVDEVIGYAAHEGGHCLWSSEDAKDYAERILLNRSLPSNRQKLPQAVEEVLRVSNILEDAFIDYHVGDQWPVLGEYIRISRRKVAERRPIDHSVIARSARPTYNQMLNLWIACSLYDEPLPSKMSARVRTAMTFLMSKSVEAVQTSNASLRLELAVDCWEHLTANFPKRDDPLPSLPIPAPPQPGGQGEQQEGDQDGSPGGAGGGQSDGEGTESESDGSQSGSDRPKSQDDTDTSGGQGADGEEEEEETEPDGAGGKPEEETPEEDIYNVDKSGDEGQPDHPEPEPEPEQEFGHFGGEKQETQDEGQTPEGGEQGGDELGSPGNLDEFDIRDLEEIPEEVLNEILDAISHELEDLTKSVAEVISQPVGSVDAQTKKADYDAPAADKVLASVQNEIQEMRRVFDQQHQVESRYLGGLTVGKLDQRKLARVGAGNFRVFKRREVLERPDLAVGLLEDVSGSMRDWMHYVWASAAVFSEGLIRKPGVNFLALTYTGGYFDVQTTRICDRDMGRLCIGNVEQGGGTPSGPAIASLKTLMDRMPERQKVIIHFTDGAPDEKYSVLSAVEACRKAGYWVWAISLHGHERMLQEQYGDGNYETIGSIRELPGKVANLVKKLVANR